MHKRIRLRSSVQMDISERNADLTPNAPLSDLNLAKRTMIADRLSVAIVKLGKVMFTSRASGVRSLIDAIKELGPSLAEASIADRVVGKAAALLCVYAKFSSVYASVMSELGSAVLKKFSVHFEHDTLVPNILDRHGTEICPFERLVLRTDSPEEAFSAIDRCSATKV